MEDIAFVIVHLYGGFWRFRTAMLARPKGTLASKLMRAIYYVYLGRFGAYIGHASTFRGEPCFPHNLHGTFVAGNAKVGANCVIFQQVTIGANAIPDSKGVGCPTIGDNVYIGAGAKIVGNITVGHNCRIGANCVVSQDIPDNSVVVPAATRVLPRDAPLDNRYFRWSPTGPQYFKDGQWIQEKDPVIIERLRDAF